MDDEGRRTWWEFAFTTAVLIVLIAGCAAVVAFVLPDWTPNESITRRQFDRVALGTPRREVVAALGEPHSTTRRQSSIEDGLPETCLFYEADTLLFHPVYYFCFSDDGTLRYKRIGS